MTVHEAALPGDLGQVDLFSHFLLLDTVNWASLGRVGSREAMDLQSPLAGLSCQSAEWVYWVIFFFYHAWCLHCFPTGQSTEVKQGLSAHAQMVFAGVEAVAGLSLVPLGLLQPVGTK